MPRDEKIHVLIAHANPLVSAGLEAAFAAHEDFHLVASRAHGAALEDTAGLASVSVAVTDCAAGMRLMTLERARRCPVLIVTDDESEVSIRRAVELGIRGYLPLSTCIESIVRAVRCIHSGGTAIAPIVMAKMAVSLRSRALTGREVEVLRLVMQGLPDKAIARRLQRSVGTAKSHVKAILTKLEASSRGEAIAVAWRRGLVHDESITLRRERAPARDVGELLMLP
jgi:two-component system NarL family response regulator